MPSSFCNSDPYHGYWPKDIYALNENFGTEEDLISLSDAIHARGMYLMLDIVPNHMASPGPFNATDWSSFNPFNSSEYFHSPCFPDYNNMTSVYVCQAGDTKVTLADLKTENTTVREIMGAWIKNTVEKYRVDGLRLDSAKSIEPSFWAGFLGQAGVFAMAEYFEGDAKVFPSVLDNLPGAMNYPIYFMMQRCMTGSMSDLTELITGIRTMKGTMKTRTLGMFTDNNDQQRWASINADMARVKNSLAFAHLMDGFPVVYYGAEQHFTGAFEPSNRQNLWSSGYRTDTELYRWYRKLNHIRALVIGADPAFIPYQAEPMPIYTSSNGTVANKSTPVKTMMVKKSDVVSVITNVGLGGARHNITLDASATLYIADTVYVDLLSCERFKTTSNGQLTFEIAELPRIFFPASKVDSQVAQPGDSEDSCAGVTYVPGEPEPSCLVTFNITASTELGESIEILSDLPQLGNGDVHRAVALDTGFYPVWTATIELPPGESISYQYLKINSEGEVVWDGGSKGALVQSYTVPQSCQHREFAATPPKSWEGGSTARKPRLVRRRY